MIALVTHVFLNQASLKVVMKKTGPISLKITIALVKVQLICNLFWSGIQIKLVIIIVNRLFLPFARKKIVII
jgi:hypothetical protein